MENAILTTDLCILNDGRPTHLSTHGSFTHIDISLCSENLLRSTSWNILDDMYSSDHFPIIIRISSRNNAKRYNFNPKFLLKFADWNKYSDFLDEELHKRPQTENINKEASLITKAIRTAAHLSIPQSSLKKKTSVPWWNKNLSLLRKNKFDALNAFRSSPTTPNLISYRKQKSIFRREMRKQEKNGYANFTNDINRDSSVSEIWSKINRLCNNNINMQIMAIKSDSHILTDTFDIAESFANVWSEYSYDINFSEEYNNLKSNISTISYSEALNFNTAQLEKRISTDELFYCLKKVCGTMIGYHMQ